MTEFTPNDQTIWWNKWKSAGLIRDYKLIYLTPSIHEAYLFAFICKSDGFSNFIGSATTTQEALDLIDDAGGEKLICLLSDSFASDCGYGISLAVQAANDQSHSVLIVNDPEKLHSLPLDKDIFSGLCSSGSLGRGGLFSCLEGIFVSNCRFIDSDLKQAFAELDAIGATTLNTRERDILVYVAQGLTNREIARKIYLAERTVRDYVSSILTKLALENRAGAAAWAVRHGIASD